MGFGYIGSAKEREREGRLLAGVSESCLNALEDVSEPLQTKDDTAGLERLSKKAYRTKWRARVCTTGKANLPQPGFLRKNGL